MTRVFYFKCTTHTAHTLAAEHTDACLQPTIPIVLCLQCEEPSLCKCAASSQNPAKGLMQTAELVIYYKYTGIKYTYQGLGGKRDFRFYDLFCLEEFYSIKPILNQAGFILNVWTLTRCFIQANIGNVCTVCKLPALTSARVRVCGCARVANSMGSAENSPVVFTVNS